MTYCYGDTTPFPLNENFIETLTSAVEACVALYQEEAAELDRSNHRKNAQRGADEEILRLDRLDRIVQDALQALAPIKDPTRPSDRAAAEIGRSTQSITESMRQEARRHLQESLDSLKTDISSSIRKAVSPFFLKHQLPYTYWRIHWLGGIAGDAPALHLHAAAADLNVFFLSDIPRESIFSEPIRASSIQEPLWVEVAPDPASRKKSKRKADPIHRHVITELRSDPGKIRVVLQPNAKKRMDGIEILVQAGEESPPVVTFLDERGRPKETPQKLEGQGATTAMQLAIKLEENIGELMGMRTGIRSIRLGKGIARDEAEPGRVADIILSTIGPIVKEIRLRSSVPGELVIKRDLGEGRREELFVPRHELIQKIAPLSPEQRQMFAKAGLSPEDTDRFSKRAQAELERPR